MQTCDLYLKYWPGVREGLFQALDRLTDEQLAFAPREGLWPLGQIAVHIAEAEGDGGIGRLDRGFEAERGLVEAPRAAGRPASW